MATHGTKLNTLLEHSPAIGAAGQESFIVIRVDTTYERTLCLSGVDFFAAFDAFADINNLIYQSLIVYKNLKVDPNSSISVANQIADSQAKEAVWGVYTRSTEGGRDFAEPMKLRPAGDYSFVHRYKLGGPTVASAFQGLVVRGELILEPPHGVERL